MEIPLVVALWEKKNFQGKRRLIIEDTPNLKDHEFNAETSAIGVHPGPQYETWKSKNGGKEPVVALYKEANYKGVPLRITAGEHADIHLFSFGDSIKSIKFNPQPIKAVKPIPLIVELYTEYQGKGTKRVIIENSPNLIDDFGFWSVNGHYSIRLKKGPDYVDGFQVLLYYGVNYQKQCGEPITISGRPKPESILKDLQYLKGNIQSIRIVGEPPSGCG